MGKLVVNTNVSLDGVMQAPAGPDEDPRGGFEHGGWASPYFDRVMAEQARRGIDQGGAFLFGRRTYEWENSTLLHGDAAEAVAELKQQQDKDLVILGSGELVRSLMPHGLIDEYRLLIHPLVLGSGRRLFTHDGTFATLRLVDTTATTTGVVIATYVPGDPPSPPSG